jgi:hypothetical protein
VGVPPLKTSDHPRGLSDEDFLKLLSSYMEGDGRAFDRLDSKAGLVLGFAMVSLAEILGFLLLAAGENHKINSIHPRLVEGFFIAGLSLIVTGAIFSTLALYPRGFTNAPSIRVTSSELPSISSIINSFIVTGQRNDPILSKKARLTQIACVLVPLGLFCFAGDALLLFMSVALAK